ncbi:MAG TPA: hypothetical protein VKK79_11155 [Candidatus Lokiarchaeia archaeon]|nr:hypothetical protein [Candidatus Lokiarchaeia archaeon]
MVVYFSFLLHIYQPPTQIAPVLKQITLECYRPLVAVLGKHPNAKITLNINGTLTEQLADYGFTDVIDGFAALEEQGQVEFTGSAKFHPLLPLLPEPEVTRQIELNYKTNRQFFGKIYAPRGFFPPEMAISDELFPVLAKKKFDWAICSGIANSLEEWPTTFISSYENGIRLVFRDDLISTDCAFDKVNTVEAFANRIKYKNTKEDYYVILAMDGETFGHHVKHAIRNFLDPLFGALPHRQDIRLVTVSDLVDTFPPGAIQSPKASSWSTMHYDLERNVPFPLWFDPKNPLHMQQHRLIMLAMTLVHLTTKYRESMDKNQKEMLENARNLLDRGIHSCQQWWASKRPYYSPDMILRGLDEIVMAVVNAKRSIPDSVIPDIKEAANLILESVLESQNKIVLGLD